MRIFKLNRHQILYLLFSLSVAYCRAQNQETGFFLTAFSNRLDSIERNIPNIIKAAEAAAKRTIAHTNMLIDVPYGIQPSFAEEMVNRAGCLANALPSVERPSLITSNDVVLLSVRSWEKDKENIVKEAKQCHEKKHMIILFASIAGMPEDINADFLIDNFSPEETAYWAPLNAVINVLNGWLWTCEYTSALTRHGKHPGILQSILEPNGQAHNSQIQSPVTRRLLFPCDKPIEQGKLARAYIAQVRKITAETGNQATLYDIKKASEILVSHFLAGGRAGVAAATHILLSEIFHDNKSPWKPFNVVWHATTAFKENLSTNHILVWFSAVGISTPLEDYNKYIKETGVRCITCFIKDPSNATNNDTGRTLHHIEPAWRLPDSSVEIPFPPGKMAPVSGINQGLLYRMLDETVSEELAQKQKK